MPEFRPLLKAPGQTGFCGQRRREAAADQGVEFHYEDFRSGWRQGIDLSREWGVYRQPYCGCILSEYDRYRKRLGR